MFVPLNSFAEYGFSATLRALRNAWLDNARFTADYLGSEDRLLCTDVKLLWEAN